MAPLAPFIKNLPLIISTERLSAHSTAAISRALPERGGKTGAPSITCPIERYISIKRSTAELMSLAVILFLLFCTVLFTFS